MMGPAPEEAECVAAKGREEAILDAATCLFAAQGYNDADTQALADKIGVGKGTLYRYFPSKKALFLAAVDRVMRRMTAVIEQSVVGIGDPLDQVATAIRAYLDFFATHPEYVELLILERALFRDREKPTYFAHREKNVVRWQRLYRSLIDEGRVRNMPVDQISSVIGQLMYGTMFTNYFNGQSKSSETQAWEIVDVVYFGILADPERHRQMAERPPK